MTANFQSPSSDGPRPTALDHRALFDVGLACLRRIAGESWTDHNVHDPGITMLELLCYAATELSYRAGYSIPDLLAPQPDSSPPRERHFHTARRILTSGPLTEADHRRLLIDLPGVRNAWLRPAVQRLFADTVEGRLLHESSGEAGVVEVPLGGISDVWLELEQGADEAAVLAAARRTLQQQRNLGHDFDRITRIDEQRFNLCAELELEPTADVAQVHAGVLFAVGEHLSPRVPRHGLAELLERGVLAENIFDGPALTHGFILAADLERAELPESIRLSDVMRVVLKVPGVVAIRDLVLTPAGATEPPTDPWVVNVPSGHAARLDVASSRLVCRKRGMPVSVDRDDVTARLQALITAVVGRPTAAEDLPVPTGRFRDPARYTSIQNDFPATYGLGPDGLPGGADAERRAQVAQLKSYLLLFDQLLADYLAQLANAGALLAVDSPVGSTRFHQVVASFPGALDAYGKGGADEVAALLGMLDPQPAQLAQRDAVLDHLLARFAEGFADYAAIVRATSGAGGEDVLALKRAFLADYPRLSSGRGLGANTGTADRALLASDNVSGLQRRVALLLGSPGASGLDRDIYPEIDRTPDDEFRFRVVERSTRKILLSSSTNYLTREAAEAEMWIAMRLAGSASRYSRKVTIDGRFYFNIEDETGAITARRIEYFATDELREAAIEELIRLASDYGEERFLVVENILLRPRSLADRLMPICADSGNRSEIDPYSHRVQILLPAYGRRFAQLAFREYVERILRDECPAHLLPKICWLDRADMETVEGAYRDWLLAAGGVDAALRREALDSLIKALTTVKNVYPRASLSACESAGPHFVLDRTALGTSDETSPST